MFQSPLVPAKAGTQIHPLTPAAMNWIPAFAGMSGVRVGHAATPIRAAIEATGGQFSTVTDPSAVSLLEKHATTARDTGAITDAELKAWLDEQNDRAAAGRLTLAMPMFLAAATR